MQTEAMRKANAKYKRVKLVQYPFRLNPKKEADIIAWLDGKENRQGYIKALIRADMERENDDSSISG